MRRLAGFKYREVARRLRAFGFAFDRRGPGSHEVWRNEVTGRKVTLPHHSRDMAEGTLRAILREAGIRLDEFLNASPPRAAHRD
jgi:predicted RNA binding protein YcfA (HicA-like mRNA interferase family)